MGEVISIKARQIEIEELKEERDLLNGIISIHEAALVIIEADFEILKKENKALRLAASRIAN